MANFNTATIQGFQRAANGGLTPLAQAPIGTAAGPFGLDLIPSVP